MTGRIVFLGLLLVCVAADGMQKPGQMRKPHCSEETSACPMNFAPVCGSDGNTYANECALCVRAHKVKMEIFVVRETSC